MVLELRTEVEVEVQWGEGNLVNGVGYRYASAWFARFYHVLWLEISGEMLE